LLRAEGIGIRHKAFGARRSAHGETEGKKVLKSEVGMRPSTSSGESKGERKKDGRTAHGSGLTARAEGDKIKKQAHSSRRTAQGENGRRWEE